MKALSVATPDPLSTLANPVVNLCAFFDLLSQQPRCQLCLQPGSFGLPLCEHCHADLPWLTHACPRCAEPLPPAAPGGGLCGRCLHQPGRVQHTRSALRYQFPLPALIQQYKERANVPVLRLLARLFCDRFADGIAEQPPQLLLPVPLHRGRLFQRGYNQAAELAYWIGRELALPQRNDLCRRAQPTPHQQGLSARQRRHNLRRAFSAELPAGVARVAIIDDVITTGSTVEALAQALQRSVGKRPLSIEAWSIARTPLQHSGAR